jgi:hypothetical protein
MLQNIDICLPKYTTVQNSNLHIQLIGNLKSQLECVSSMGKTNHIFLLQIVNKDASMGKSPRCMLTMR